MTQGVQTSYEQNILKGYPGQIADLQPKIILSGDCELAPGAIPFGKAITYGTDPDRQVRIPSDEDAIGISIRDLARENDANGVAQYEEGETVGYMKNGYVYCEIDGTGVRGDALTYIASDGQLSTAAADATHIALNARLDEECATTGDLCRVYVFID